MDLPDVLQRIRPYQTTRLQLQRWINVSETRSRSRGTMSAVFQLICGNRRSIRGDLHSICSTLTWLLLSRALLWNN
ncbi:MAG TPA: hypothetical protein VFU22_17795, partial [Roseiflexaceae bacterium]|nr:hypothetical protein [Roseiflexaceae bacterium]